MRMVKSEKQRLHLEKLNNNQKGEKHPSWKGNNIGHNPLHRWIARRKPKPKFCEDCNKNKPYDLANISGKYKRDINDFKWICRSCHMKEDGRINNLKNQKKNMKYLGE